MSYQFIHIESYARTGSQQNGNKVKSKKWSIRDILAEAGREPGNYYHVENAKPPIAILGTLAEAEKAAHEWADNTKDAKGRKLRKDALCMLAGVISLPAEKKQDWEKFKRSSVEYLKHKYGDRLKAVVEHTDETHPHIHFYIVPKIGEKFDDIHDGKKAAAQAKAQGEIKGKQNHEYIEAMRRLQDNFYDKVASMFGLTRLGPGRRRLTRAQWKAEQAQANAFKRTKDKAIKYRAKVFRQSADEWAGKTLFDKFKWAWHRPSQRVQDDKAQAQEELKKKDEELKQVQEAYFSIEKTAEDRLRSGIEHARDAQKHKEELEQVRAELEKERRSKKRLEEENERLKAPKHAPTSKHTKRQGFAI